jgi:microcystin-dependent protein
MATVTKGRTFTSGETVTPAKLNDVVDLATVTNIQTADIADGQVTLAKLVTAVQQALLPAGAVQAFAMNSAPSGWLSADGTAVSRSTYASLFSAIGTTYGAGDGSTTFALPDLRGYFVRGSGTNSDGTAAGTFGAKQSQDTQPHTHGITDPGHNHVWNAVNGPGGQNFGVNYVAGIASISGNTGYSVNSSATGITINNSTGTETRPKNIALLYCIKF